MKKDYIDFQEHSVPLAYFISFRCYGTWLHGDSRGSTDRRFFNTYGTEKMPHRSKLNAIERTNLRGKPITLTKQQRSIVREAIREVCVFRKYRLLALNVRSNHVHCVVVASVKAESILTALKAYATRKLRAHGTVDDDDRVWSRHGSTKYLWRDSQVEAAIDYVLYCQDAGIPDFEF